MWMSMTGFGRGDHTGGEVSMTAEVRSVNHRFLDIHIRCPAKFFSLEMRVRSLVRETLKRGKVDVFLSVREVGAAPGHARRVETGGGEAAAHRDRTVGEDACDPHGGDDRPCGGKQGTCPGTAPGADRGPVGGGGGRGRAGPSGGGAPGS